MEDKFVLGGKEFKSRFILGSGKYNLNLIKAAVEQGGAEIAGIKMHAAIDVLYQRNHIHHKMLQADMNKNRRYQAPNLTWKILNRSTIHCPKFINRLGTSIIKATQQKHC